MAEPAPKLIQALPLILGPKNTELVTGWPYRWVIEKAILLGVPVIGIGKKRGVRADLFVAALERNQEVQPEKEPEQRPLDVVADPAALVRASLGKKLRSA